MYRIKGVSVIDIPPDLSGLEGARYWKGLNIKLCQAVPVRTKKDMDYWEIEYLRQKAERLGMAGGQPKLRSFLFPL